jgi:excisionase family DNA binding protein
VPHRLLRRRADRVLRCFRRPGARESDPVRGLWGYLDGLAEGCWAQAIRAGIQRLLGQRGQGPRAPTAACGRPRRSMRLELVVILGDDGPVLLVDARSAFILRDALRRWHAEHQRFGARQKIVAVLPLLREWEQVADAHAATLTMSANGPVPSGEIMPAVRIESERITTAEAAKRLNCSERHVRRFIARGDLNAVTIGRAKLLDPADVGALQELRRTA